MTPPLHVDQPTPLRWRGIPEHIYKEEGSTFRDVTRRVLFGAAHGQGVEVRYFEVGPGGHTTLERHAHIHTVMPIAGAGRCLIGCRIVDIACLDLVYVPPWTWHQFRAGAEGPLGLLCIVNTERDRPALPTAADLAELRTDPAVADFIRT